MRKAFQDERDQAKHIGLSYLLRVRLRQLHSKAPAEIQTNSNRVYRFVRCIE